MQKLRLLAVFVFIWICFLGWGRVDASTVPRAAPSELAAVTSDGPPQRSTAFDLTSLITFTAELRFNRNAAMTIEAWVYPLHFPDDPVGYQTFVEHQLGVSYWFGACPKLRFHRSDGTFVESSAELKPYRWTHVAVSYDGTNATFYIDGEDLGSAALPNNNNFISPALAIGGTGIEKTSTRRFGPFTVPDGATQRTTVADWPTGSQLRSELDLDGDGIFESSTLVTGRECTSQDLDESGLPDNCECPGGIYMPALIKAQ